MLLKKVTSIIMLTAFFANLSMLILSTRANELSTEACLFISPPMHIATNVGEKFEEAVNISSVEQLRRVEFTLTYDPSMLNVTSVAPGSFFSPSPRSFFESEENESIGFLKVKLSLADSEASRSGNGTLALVVFEVIGASDLHPFSPIKLERVSALDSASVPVVCDSIWGLCFWKSVQPDPPSAGRFVDVYTQRGGIGLDTPDGEFAAGEMVVLNALATYNNFPVQHVPVAFQVLNPLNETVAVLTALTDENGIAQTSFRIPFLSNSEGIWAAVGTVDIASQVVWDTVTFRVSLFQVVEGHTFPIKIADAEKPWTLYLGLLATCTTLLIAIKRKQH